MSILGVKNVIIFFTTLSVASAVIGSSSAKTTPAPASYDCNAEWVTCWFGISDEFKCEDKRLNCIPSWGKPLSDISTIKKLNYKSNRLKHLPANVFRMQFRDISGLAVVTLLDLSFNQLTQIDKGAFSGLDSLETLSLVSNDFKQVPTDAFHGLGRLKHLNLRINQIEVIHPHAFRPLKALERLELSFGHIATVSSDAFQGLKNLDYLDLTHNRLDSDSNSVTRDSFAGLQKLGTLKLASNAETFRLRDVNWMEAFGISAGRRSSLRRSDDDEEDYGDLLEFNTESVDDKSPEYYEVPCKCARHSSDPADTVTCPHIWKFFKANMTLECIGKARQPEYTLRSETTDVGLADKTSLVMVDVKDGTYVEVLRWLKVFWGIIVLLVNLAMAFLYAYLFRGMDI